MALMVRYCEKHRHAWPVADLWVPGKSCPIASAADTGCEIHTVDAIAKLNDLGMAAEAAEVADDEAAET